MNSTPNGKATESDDISIVPADDAHAYDQFASTDERLVREQLARLEQDAARRRSAVLGRLPLRGGSALRGLIGLLLAASIFAAAFASQSSYGGAAKQIIARWAPRLASTSSLPPNKPGFAERPSPAAPQMAAAQPMPSTASAQIAPQELGPIAAPLSPELAQRLQTMASDLANVEREIEQLKTSQQQLARDNASAIEQLKASEKQTASDDAKAIEQFKASQEQMASDNAKGAERFRATQEQMAHMIASLFEQNLRPKTTAPPSRPSVASTRKPVQPSPQGRVQP